MKPLSLFELLIDLRKIKTFVTFVVFETNLNKFLIVPLVSFEYRF
jgi:hypothetical protein